MDEEPDWIGFQAWQRVDASHQPGGGRPAYRAVFKTLRVAMSSVEFRWPNMVLRFGGGRVERGGVHTPDALRTRRHDYLILPEWGQIAFDEQGIGTYVPIAHANPAYAGWEEETDPCFFVEVIVDVDADTPTEKVAVGRSAIASMLTLIDLHFGRRVLGIQLTEEAGERFDDWHFSRQLGASQVGWEPQLVVEGLQHDDLVGWGRTIVDELMSLPDARRRQISLACSWFQSAGSATDPVVEYMGLWIAIEVLAMPDTNVRPLRDQLVALAGGEQAGWGRFVGLLFAVRGDLVHGVRRGVPTEAMTGLRAVARLVIAAEFGLPLERRLAETVAARDAYQ
jgi:hypothetical protein